MHRLDPRYRLGQTIRKAMAPHLLRQYRENHYHQYQQRCRC